MNELKRIVEDIQSVFSESSYPRDFLETYDQMECLASHNGRETFLVRKKENGEQAVAKCYDRARFPIEPHPELLRDIDHPGLPRFHEQYRNDQMLCLIREYVEGTPLNEYAKEKQLTTEEIISFGKQLCDILSTLHGHVPPVIHRDIKPENIIVKPDGTLALIDFDISRAYRENTEADTVFFGTKGYAAPEQYGFGQTDKRTDIYALGVLLRWLVTGSTKDNHNVTMAPGLQKVIERCTAFSPDERFNSAEEVRQALETAGKKRFPVGKAVTGACLLIAALCCGFLLGRFTDWLKMEPQATFTEPLIEHAVRLQLGKENGALTEEDLGQVRYIYIYGSEAYRDQDEFEQQRVDDHAEGPLRTLDDLKQLPNLQEIHIARQGYLDVSGIADLTGVYTVNLKHMHISGVPPIAHLSRLKHVILFDCGVTDVTALEGCPWIETLDIGLNELTDLKQIGSHPKVTSLGMMWLNMENLDGIADRMPNLQAVTLQHGSVKDLTGLKDLPHLKNVYVLEEQYDDVSTLLAGTDVEIHVTEN